MFNFIGASMNGLERALDAATLRQKVVASNIANAEVPYFKRSEVRFEEYLNSSMESGNLSPFTGSRTDPRHLYIGRASSFPQPEIVTDQTSVMNNNLNNVDIDREMTFQAENQLRYNLFVQQVNHEMRQLRTAIEGRR